MNELKKKLAAPAQRALANEGISTLEQLAGYSEVELMKLHGIGKCALSVIKIYLEIKGIELKTNK